MCEEALQEILARIKATPLGNAAYRAARELLDLIGPDGCTRLTVGELADLTGCSNYRAARDLVREVEASVGCTAGKSYGLDEFVVNWHVRPNSRRFDDQCAANHRELAAATESAQANSRRFDDQFAANHRELAEENAAKRRELADTDQPGPPNSRQNGDGSAAKRRELDIESPRFQSAPIRERAPALVSQLASSDPLPDQKLTNYPPPPEFPAASCGTQNGSGVTLAASEVAVSEALLRAAGMSRRKAMALASAHPFYLVQKATARWWYGRKSKGGRFREEPGIVVRMLEDPDEYNLASYAIPESWWYSDLGRFQPPSRRRHRGQTPPLRLAESAPQAAMETWQQDIEENDLEEMGRDAGATCGAPPDPAPPGSPSALCAPVNWRRPGAEGTTDPLQAAWAQILDELATGMPGLWRCLEGSTCAPDPDGHPECPHGMSHESVRIVVANRRGLDYAQRATPMLSRSLGSILGRAVHLEIVAETEQTHEPQLAG